MRVIHFTLYKAGYNTPMEKRALIVIAAILFAITTSYAAQKNVETISAGGSGNAAITGGDYLEARQKAKSAATAEALWKAIEAISGADATAQEEKIRSSLMPRAMDFVHKYKFSEETISPDGGNYHIAMEVIFFADLVQSELEKLGTAVTLKKGVVILIDERPMEGVTDASFMYTGSLTEERLKKAAQEAGYRATGRVEVRGLKDDARAAKAIAGDKDALLWLAERLKGDYVITGKSRVTSSGTEIRGTTQITAYGGREADAAWTSEAVETVAGATGTDRFKAVRKCADKLSDPLTEFLGKAKEAKPAEAPAVPPAPPAPTATP